MKRATLAAMTAALLVSTLSSLMPSRAQALPIPFELFTEAEPRTLRSHIPAENNPSVQKWVKFFSVDDRERFDRFMQRGALYKTLIQDILVEHGVPPEMYYLAMIESGFARRARSHARAVGVWQFMAPTAKLYGLRVDKEVDERMDVIRATRAAARHLKDLKNEFGSWYLAMAAYNCGSGCVRRAVRKHDSKDFWRLVRRRAIPSETANYVPKFQAAMLIARNPEKFGFERKTLYEFPLVRRVKVPAKTHLADVARKYNVPTRTLIALNQHLIRGHTPSGKSTYEIWIPKTKKNI